MDKLARLLSVERRLLEFLLFKLVEGRHLLSAGEARFLPFAAADVVQARERVGEVALLRSMLVSDVARHLEIPEESATLGILARASAEPFGTIFADHRLAFLDLTAEIEDVTRQNRRLAERGANDAERLVAVVGEAERRADDLRLSSSEGPPAPQRHVVPLRPRAAGRTSSLGIAEAVIDLQVAEHGYQAVLGAVSGLPMPSLLDFLR